ncbi:MAG TPA: hypothetical protein VMR41_05765 [Patescibacteria group bacterium]|nr:hypothetical protein [Patescibacteria group bacterium]
MKKNLLNNSKLPKLLNGIEVANVIEEIYNIAGNLGPRLVEANIVLTLANARGQTEFFIENPKDIDRGNIEKVNNNLSKEGILMYAIEPSFISPSSKKETLMVNIDNFKGYERNSKMTHIPGIPPYDSNTGKKGYKQWIQEAQEGLTIAIKSRELICDEADIVHILSGVIKGYPDIAILDYFYPRRLEIKKEFITSDIPYASLYDGAQPLFNFLPEHINDISIVKTIHTWNRILEEFYNSKWHEYISNTIFFKSMRSGIIELA